MAKKFSIGEAVRFGWNTMKANLGFFIGIMLIVGAITFFLNRAIGWVQHDAFLLSFVIITHIVIGSIMQVGLIRIMLKFCDNQKGEFGDLFSCSLPLLFKYLAGSLMCSLIVFVGLILLIVPGIIWGIKFQFVGYFIVDKGLGPIEALKKSSAITKGVKWDLFLFDILCWGIFLLGFLCLIIGLFAAVPTIRVAFAFVYRRLESQLEIAHAPVIPQET